MSQLTEAQKQAKAQRAKNRRAGLANTSQNDGFIRWSCWFTESDEFGVSVGDIERWTLIYRYPGDPATVEFTNKLEARRAEARAIGHLFYEYEDGEGYQEQTMVCSSREDEY